MGRFESSCAARRDSFICLAGSDESKVCLSNMLMAAQDNAGTLCPDQVSNKSDTFWDASI